MIEPLPTDEITLIFKDYKNEVVAEFSSTGVNSIDVDMTSSLTEKFQKVFILLLLSLIVNMSQHYFTIVRWWLNNGRINRYYFSKRANC